MKLAIVIGTRPEAIKLAPIVLEAKKRKDIDVQVIATGQHKEMLEQMLKVFEIEADADLSIMKHNQNLCHVTTSALEGLYNVYGELKPDWVIVQGDTTTTFAGALAAFYLNIPVAHVEAGLRTFDKREPFPEEANRCMTTQLAELHLAPTNISQDNLLKEGVNASKVEITGNTAIDALFLTIDNLKANGQLKEPTSGKRKILVTAHRRENQGERMGTICDAVLALLDKFDDIEIEFPVHMSPRVREVVFGKLDNNPRISLIDPLNYVDFVKAMHSSHIILTDSGGVQEEAPSLGKPVVVLRDQTERPEASIAGTAVLVGAHFDKIVNTVSELLTDDAVYKKMSEAINPYGDGTAAIKTLDRIQAYIAEGK